MIDFNLVEIITYRHALREDCAVYIDFNFRLRSVNISYLCLFRPITFLNTFHIMVYKIGILVAYASMPVIIAFQHTLRCKTGTGYQATIHLLL